MNDFRWLSAGGVLLDGNGDFQMTDPSIPESLVDMIFTHLKADVDSWKLYDIGANLSLLIGDTVDPELELKIKRQITSSLTRYGLLPQGSFTVETVPGPKSVLAIVYLDDTSIAQVTIPRKQGEKITVQ